MKSITFAILLFLPLGLLMGQCIDDPPICNPGMYAIENEEDCLIAGGTWEGYLSFWGNSCEEIVEADDFVDCETLIQYWAISDLCPSECGTCLYIESFTSTIDDSELDDMEIFEDNFEDFIETALILPQESVDVVAVFIETEETRELVDIQIQFTITLTQEQLSETTYASLVDVNSALLALESQISDSGIVFIWGCTDTGACNFAQDATIDDGNCTYAEENYDCDHNCIVDIDCTGECGGNSVEDECGVCDGEGPEECWDGSTQCDPADCPDQPGETIEIMYDSDIPIAGFQFNVIGVTVIGALGGAAEEAGFMISSSETMVIGFSITGATIAAGEGVLVVLNIEGDANDACLENVILSDSDGEQIEQTVEDCINIVMSPGWDGDACTMPDHNIHITSSGSVLYHSSTSIAGFQFEVEGGTVLDASGGAAGDAGLLIQVGNGTVLAFSLSGTSFSGCGTMVEVDMDGEATGLSDIIISDTFGVAISFEYFDGSGSFDIYGCMDINACNYDNDATIDNGSCIVPETNYDCDGNCTAGEDCTGACGGTAIEDECGICNGSGPVEGCGCDDIPDGYCDCDGNVDFGCGCGEAGPSGCDNQCGSTAEVDECGECGGNGPDVECWDSSMVCDLSSCADIPQGMVEILYESPEDIKSFLFEIENVTVTDAYEGAAQDADFNILLSNGTIQGFNLSGSTLPAGNDTLVILDIEGNLDEVCINAESIQFTDENDQELFTVIDNCLTIRVVPCEGDTPLDECGVCGGNGVDVDEDDICDDIDDCIGEYDECGICNGNGPVEGYDCDGYYLADLDFLQSFIDSSGLGIDPLALGEQTWSNYGRLNTLIIYNVLNGSTPENISIPENIGNLDSLTSLTLEQNSHLTGQIPLGIGNLTILTELNLQYNNITGEIPDTIGNLMNLSVLKLRNNQLSGDLPDKICDINTIDWASSSFTIKNNYLCPPFPECLEDHISYSSQCGAYTDPNDDQYPEACNCILLGCTDTNSCNYTPTCADYDCTDDGSCEYPIENYDCDGDCTVIEDCSGECGGSAIVDECGNCNGTCFENETTYFGLVIPDFIVCSESEHNDITAGCDGICGSPFIEDECGNCSGNCSSINPETNEIYSDSLIVCGDNAGIFRSYSNDFYRESFLIMCQENDNTEAQCGEIFENSISSGMIQLPDCAGVCGGTAAVDECNICGGSGIPDDECDCDGNIDLGCGCNADGPSGCDVTCGSELEFDQCGICGGGGPEEGYDCDGILLSMDKTNIPDKYAINNIYPNPFNPVTNINYSLPVISNVNLLVYDMRGREIATIYNGIQTPGYHSKLWDASKQTSGIYFVKIIANEYTSTHKIILIK